MIFTSRLYYKYTNIWEGIRSDFKADTKVIVDIVRGAANAILDLVKALVGLGWGIISYTASAVVLAVTSPTKIKPKWAEEIFDGTNTAIGGILKDPMLLVEGLSQQVSDTFEEEGAAYSIGYVAGDFLGAKGLDKLSKVGKAKLTGVGNVVEDIEDVAKVSDDVGETVAEAIEKATTKARAIGIVDQGQLTKIGENAAEAMSKGRKFTEPTLPTGRKTKGKFRGTGCK